MILVIDFGYSLALAKPNNIQGNSGHYVWFGMSEEHCHLVLVKLSSLTVNWQFSNKLKTGKIQISPMIKLSVYIPLMSYKTGHDR